MVELRKRKAPAEPAPPPPPRKKSNPVKSAVAKAKGAITGQQESATTNGGPSGKLAVGEKISLDGFGGEIELHDGEKTTLKQLIDNSKAGVVLFTYPKASTPGCTNQACLFRDSYTQLTSTGLAIYGLSTDSPKSNTTFKTKQNLPYSLLCDPNATLIGAIGMKKAPKGTTRGVFAVDKGGKVLAAEAGGPAATVDVVQKLVGSNVEPASTTVEAEKVEASEGPKAEEPKIEEPAPVDGTKAEAAVGNVSAEVAETAAKIDGDAKV